MLEANACETTGCANATARRVVYLAQHQAQVNVGIGIAIEHLCLATSGKQLNFELMHARLRQRDHVNFGARRIVIKVRGLPRLGPVRSHLAYGDVVEVFEHIVERYPKAAVVVE